jgi:hypothetical protein
MQIFEQLLINVPNRDDAHVYPSQAMAEDVVINLMFGFDKIPGRNVTIWTEGYDRTWYVALSENGRTWYW